MLKKLFTIGVILFGALLFSFTLSNKAYAATCTWNGSVNEDWNNAANWDPGCTGTEGIPGNGDDIVLPESPNTYNLNNNINNLELNSLTIYGDSNNYYEIFGNDISIAEGITTTYQAATTTIYNNITFTGNQQFNIQATNFNGNINLNGNNLNINATNDNSVFNGIISGEGDITISGDAVVYFNNDNTFTASLLITDDGEVGLGHNNGFGIITNTVTFEGNNLFLIDGPDLNNVQYNFTMSGDVSAWAVTDAVINGDITFETLSIQIISGVLTLNGALNGDILTKDYNGGLTLGGNTSNSLSDAVIVYGGTLTLSKTDGATAVDADITVGGITSAVLNQTNSDQISDSVNITIYQGGEWNLDNNNEDIYNLMLYGGTVAASGGDLYVRGITMQGGLIDSGDSGNVDLSGNILIQNSNETSVIRGHLTLLMESTQITVDDSDEDADLEITASIHGQDQIEFIGGEIILSGDNNYTGKTILHDAAEVLVMNANAFGTDDKGTEINDTSYIVIYIDFFDGYIYEPFVLNGNGDGTFSAINSAGNPILRGLITLNTDSDFKNLSSENSINIWGKISGLHNISFSLDSGSGPSSISLHNSESDFIGTVTINSGISLEIRSANALNNNAVIIHNNATLTLGMSGLGDGINTTVGSISGEGDLEVLSSLDGYGSLTIGLDNTSKIFDGRILGDGNIFKVGTGTWTLTGSNTNTGTFIINEGKVIFNGTDVYGPVQLSGGTLGGNATLQTVTGYSGKIAPGNSPGTLQIIGDLILTEDMSLDFELNGSTLGTEYDHIAVSENVQLGNSTLNLDLGFIPTIGTTFTIISTEIGGSISGIFNGLPDNSTLIADGFTFRINYTQNSVLLTVITLPALASTGTSVPVTLVLVTALTAAGIIVFTIRKRILNK